jgi:trans-aconitate methyltransferase
MKMRRSVLLSLALTVLVAVAAGAQAPAPSPGPKKPLDVPYVPTNDRVVAEMLKMADVKKNDVLYDLGSGDGRIPITAAKRFGTRGVGIDIDPERVAEAKQNAITAGVADRVRFLEGDIFDADIKEATVVTLYLLPEINLRLRPKLLADLKPGTRLVSHNYDMGDWAPLKTVTLEVSGTTHTVYYWVIPKRPGS